MKKGGRNRRTDFIYLTLIFVPTLELLSRVRKLYKKDAVIQKILSEVVKGEANCKYTLRGGCLYYKDMLYVPNDQAFKNQLFHILHSSPIGGHSSFD